MQATDSQPTSRPSITETARREQIVRATIETLAELGYAKTSFTQIARRCGLSSTGLISYHFANKSELMWQVVETIVTGISQYVSNRMRTATSPPDALRTYILATTDYIGAYQADMRALLDVVLGGALSEGMAANQQASNAVEGILRAGQQSGAFRDFDPMIMASVIQRAIEGLPVLLAANPGLDPARYGRELATMFEVATRKQDA